MEQPKFEIFNDDKVFVNYDQFDSDKLLSESVVEKQDPKSQDRYREINLKYRYENNDNVIIDDCYFQFPSCKSTGIFQYSNTSGPKYYMMITLSINNNRHQSCINTIKQLYGSCSNIIEKNRRQLKLFDFKADEPYGFKNPVYYPRDCNTGEILPNRDPKMRLKLIFGENGTLFSYPYINPRTKICEIRHIDWKYLKDVDITFIPLVKFERICVSGGRPVLQCKIINAVVQSVVSRKLRKVQYQTIENLISTDHQYISRISSQLSILESNYQDEEIAEKEISTYISTKPDNSCGLGMPYV